MRALITNDDGIGSEGLRVLALTAERAGLAVLVAAPDRESSGCGAGMTAVEEDGRVVVAAQPLDGVSGPAYAVAALPGFITAVAARGAFGDPPGLVLSGINRGPNTGRAIVHSGTVGAAMTAAGHGCPAIAVSLDTGPGPGVPAHWETAAAVTAALLPLVLSAGAPLLLNVNVPNVPPGRLAGIRQARLARAGRSEMRVAEAGEGFVRVAVAETGEEPGPGTDVALLAAGYATVSAVEVIRESPAELRIPEFRGTR